MSIVANKMIIDSLRENLKDKLTYKDMEIVIDAVKETLADYEIKPTVIEETGTDMMMDAFVDAMRVEGKSDKTLERYKYILKRFLKFAGVTTYNITQYHIRNYLASEKNRGIADSTIRGYCWVFSAYFGWLHRDGIISKNPMGNIGNIKVQKKVKEVFTEIELEKLKSGCNNIRDKAIICFLENTGCRISEVTGLNRDDIDFINLRCVVLGKGNKQRTVYMDAVTGMIVQNYLMGRKDDNPALFANRLGDRIRPGGIRIMLNKLGDRAGVERVYPHKFRRTEITRLVNRGMPIEQVKTIAGHEKIDTTMGYVKVDQQNVEYSYRKFS